MKPATSLAAPTLARWLRMTPALLPVAVATTLAASSARAEEGWLLQVEGSLAAAVAEPQKSRFGPGVSASAGAFIAFRPQLLVGARLRLGALADGDAPSDPTLRPAGWGGIGALLLAGRFRPLSGPDGGSRALGPWIELGLGPGLTGRLTRAVAEAGAGYGFKLFGVVIGPSARYTHVLQPNGGLDGVDAKLVILGVELAVFESGPSPPPSGIVGAVPRSVLEPAPVLAASTAPPANPDSDDDGIPDLHDACPRDPEDDDGFEDGDGCPDGDNDKDGIADAEDACPDEAEVLNGVKDQDGCPDNGLIEIVDGRLVFEYHLLYPSSWRIKRAARLVLAAIVDLWRRHPEWERIDVEGHADSRGPEAYNRYLSRARARRVGALLVRLGLPPDRIRAVGFGSSRLRDPGTTPEAHRRNRRVELVIRERAHPGAPESTKPTGSPSGTP